MKPINLSRGFSLIEVLISFVILVIGILGATILIMRSSQVNMTAYETEQAAIIANNMIETIRIDPDNAKKYATADREGYNSLPSDCKSPAPKAEAQCTAAELVKLNWQLFNVQLKSTNLPNASLDVREVTNSTANAGSNNNKQFLIIISWGPDASKKINTYTVDFIVTVPLAVTPPNGG